MNGSFIKETQTLTIKDIICRMIAVFSIHAVSLSDLNDFQLRFEKVWKAKYGHGYTKIKDFILKKVRPKIVNMFMATGWYYTNEDYNAALACVIGMVEDFFNSHATVIQFHWRRFMARKRYQYKLRMYWVHEDICGIPKGGC